jgi:hypothetical protein
VDIRVAVVAEVAFWKIGSNPANTCCAMVSFFASVLGGIVSGAIGFASAYCMSNINARRVAAERLRAAFAPELAAMRRARADKNIDRQKLVTDAFPRHAVAIEEFRLYVPHKSRDAYQAAWQRYYEVGGSIRFFDYFMPEGGPENFINRVEAILAFASPPHFLWF